MNKLTAEKCREMFLNLFERKRQDGITMKEDLYMQALEIALPILEQQERGESEWIEWGGGNCPALSMPIVEVKFRNGQITNDVPHCFDWSVRGGNLDIIAYRLVKS